MRLCIKFPTRGRPVRAARALAALRATASGEHPVHVVVVADSDDPEHAHPALVRHACRDHNWSVRLAVGPPCG